MRKYITACEWNRVFEAITGGSNTVRDRAMFHLAYRHGLRVSELTGVRIGDLDMSGKSLYVQRLKNGLSTVQPVQSDTLCLLREWLKIREEYLSGKDSCDWLFLSQEGKRLSRQHVFRLARRYGERAGLPFAFHPHMLRHACGMPAAMRLQTRGWIPASYRIIWDIKISTILCATRLATHPGFAGRGSKILRKNRQTVAYGISVRIRTEPPVTGKCCTSGGDDSVFFQPMDIYPIMKVHDIFQRTAKFKTEPVSGRDIHCSQGFRPGVCA